MLLGQNEENILLGSIGEGWRKECRSFGTRIGDTSDQRSGQRAASKDHGRINAIRSTLFPIYCNPICLVASISVIPNQLLSTHDQIPTILPRCIIPRICQACSSPHWPIPVLGSISWLSDLHTMIPKKGVRNASFQRR